MVISEGAPAWMQVIPMGGELLTQRSAVVTLKTPIGDAEYLKLQYGHSHTGLAPPKEMVQVKKLADRPLLENISRKLKQLPHSAACRRVSRNLGKRLHQTGRFEEASMGIVLCGGTRHFAGDRLVPYTASALKQAHQEGLDGLLRHCATAASVTSLALDFDQEVRPNPLAGCAGRHYQSGSTLNQGEIFNREAGFEIEDQIELKRGH